MFGSFEEFLTWTVRDVLPLVLGVATLKADMVWVKSQLIANGRRIDANEEANAYVAGHLGIAEELAAYRKQKEASAVSP